jgi:hypothetical protein
LEEKIIKITNKLRLSRGMMRIYTVLAFATFLTTLTFTWKNVQHAEKWLRDSSEKGIIIYGWTTLTERVSGKTVDLGPANISIGYGWATYMCLQNAGYPLYTEGETYVHAQWTKTIKEYDEIIDSEQFTKCVVKIINDAKTDVMITRIESVAISLLSCFFLYILFLILSNLYTWIRDGFNSP